MKKQKKKFLSLLFLFIIISVSLFFKLTLAVDETVSVDENEELTYYIKVANEGDSYDSFLYVEDQIPNGLIFEDFLWPDDSGFVSQNDMFGAAPIAEGNTCSGYVVNDTTESIHFQGEWNNDNTEYTFHGLHYDAVTRTVKFTIHNLKPGCMITIGVITKVPELSDPEFSDVDRLDFYNSASLVDNLNMSFSNTLHHYLGNDSTNLYDVNYSFTGDVPNNIPNLPVTTSYSENSNVSVMSNIIAKGYKFNGWTTSDVIVTDGSFKMPNHVVNFSGDFTELVSHNVSYRIEGTVPEGYIVPKTRSYYEGENVIIDQSLQYGDDFNGYRFLGWKINNVDARYYDNATTQVFKKYIYPDFSMPNQDIELVGTFEPIKYKITYRFTNTLLPLNSDELLPEPEYYYPGETVTLPTVHDENVSGYKFNNWYKSSPFTMPAKDLVIYGQWKIFYGYVNPDITFANNHPVTYNNAPDNIHYTININNNTETTMEVNGFKIFDDNNEYYLQDLFGYISSGYIYSENYVLENQQTDPGLKSTFTYDGKYNTSDLTSGNKSFGVQLIDPYLFGYELEEGKDVYTIDYTVKPSIEICQNIDGKNTYNAFQYKIIGTNGYETATILHANECSYVSVEPGTYTIKQTIPQDYIIKTVSGDMNQNGGTITVNLEDEPNVTFTDQYVKNDFLHMFGRILDAIYSAPINEPTNGEDYFG